MDAIYELKQQMLFLEQAHASARMGHFVLDPKRQTIEFSSWVRDNIGLNDMPIPLERLPEIVPEGEREEFARTVSEIITTEDDFAFETNVVTAKGKVRTQRVTVIPAFENRIDRTGFIGYYGILQEITSERRAQEELVAARDKAEAELQARTNILAAVSHEIRTPLGGILGIIDQLKRERSAAERERALGLVEDSARILMETLDAILQQARLAQDVSEREAKPFRPSAVAQRVAEMFRPLARRKGIRIEVNAASQAEAMGDPGRIQQVLANFVSNAVKFTQAGVVTIYVQPPADDGIEWSFTVSDTGAGMDKSRIDTVFDPFDTIGKDTLGRSVGAGLGLSISRDIVIALGGRIEVESELGRGSSFTVFLPLEKIAAATATQSNDAVSGTVLIAGGKATEQIQIEAIAGEHGWEVIRPNNESRDCPDMIVVTDSDGLKTLSDNFVDASQSLVMLGDYDDLSALSDPNLQKLVHIPTGQIMRLLPQLLGEARSNADA